MYLRVTPSSVRVFKTLSGTRLFMSRRISANGRVMKELFASRGTA
jgi:hypothetical protein